MSLNRHDNLPINYYIEMKEREWFNLKTHKLMSDQEGTERGTVSLVSSINTTTSSRTQQGGVDKTGSHTNVHLSYTLDDVMAEIVWSL